MRICRFSHNGAVRTGVIAGDVVREAGGSIFDSSPVSGAERPLAAVKLLPPCEPTKIVAVAVNYRVHARAGYTIPDEPLIFLKPPSAVIGHEDAIVFPDMARQVDFEGELGVVIGKEARGVLPAEAPAHVLGYTCANDVTARDVQDREGHFARAKGFDTFAPVGPWIETELDPSDVLLETFLNGERKQSSSTSDMAFPVPEIVAFVSRVMTLKPGDLVMTGTPAGMGPMQAGDVVEVRIGGIGALRNTLATGAARP
jgi:2-keto-4-pentenoate hydratase/2-oxohepta-3-ene-1,7-dioic acid hydratase in catechol pathway